MFYNERPTDLTSEIAEFYMIFYILVHTAPAKWESFEENDFRRLAFAALAPHAALAQPTTCAP